MTEWAKVTEVSGWAVEEENSERQGPARPVRVQYDGHWTPEEALTRAEEHGMDPSRYVTVEHKVVVEGGKWYRPCLACHWTRKNS